MKKSLFAIAAVTAFAGAAQAQSSVTVYGIVDVGYIGSNAKASTVTATGGQATPAETSSQLGQSAQTTSRLGFRGTEDLGGGLSAMFTLETGMSPNSSTLSGFNNRQAFVGLKKNGIGAAMIGTQYTPIHTAVGATGANQYNNLTGDVIYPQNTGITNRDGSASNSNAGYTVRSSNMLKLESDTFAGFKATGFVAQNNRNENQTSLSPNQSATALQGYRNGEGFTGGTNDSTGWGLGVNYTWQKLLVTANYQSFKTRSAWTYRENLTTVTQGPGATTAVVVTPARSGVATGNSTDNQMYFAGTYDFGILKAYAQYISRKETSGLDSSFYAKRTAQQIGVRSFITPKIEAWASGGMGRYTANGTGSPTANFTGYQLGANYWLSKRTNLYTIFGATNTSTTSAQVDTLNANGQNGTASRNFSANANNYAVGIRHTF